MGTPKMVFNNIQKSEYYSFSYPAIIVFINLLALVPEPKIILWDYSLRITALRKSNTEVPIIPPSIMEKASISEGLAFL